MLQQPPSITSSGQTIYWQAPSSSSAKPLAFTLDFATPKMQALIQQPISHHLLAKSIGIKKLPPNAWIVDATAGFGQDAFIMASLGFHVTLIERVPIIATLLQRAIAAVKPDSWAFPIVQRMTVLNIDAVEWLSQLHDQPEPKSPSILYLDPMFPAEPKKALSQKSMQILKAVAGTGDNAEGLLPLALALAPNRVVVKRHRHSPPLDNLPPDITFTGKSHRFDVYHARQMHQIST